MRRIFFDSSSGSPDSGVWHAWRAEGIGGSDAVHIASGKGIIDSIPDWANPGGIIASKVGLYVPETNDAMRRGSQWEEWVRGAVNQMTGKMFLPAFGEMDENPIVRASLDGVSLFDEILEIKCPNDRVHALAKRGEVVDYYRAQIAHQLMVLHGNPRRWAGSERVFFVSAKPEEGDIAIVEQTSGEYREMAISLYEAEMRVWEEILGLRDDPETEEIVSLLEDTLFIQAAQIITYHERRQGLAKKIIREHVMNGGECDWVEVTTRKRSVKDYESLNVPPEVLEKYRETTWCFSFKFEHQEEVEVEADVDEAKRIYLESKQALSKLSEEAKIFEEGKARLTRYSKAKNLPIRKAGVKTYSRSSINWKKLCEDLKYDPPSEVKEETVLRWKC